MHRDKATAALGIFAATVLLVGSAALPRMTAASGSLALATVGNVDSSAYPTIGITISLADAVTGRPSVGLTSGSIAVNDPTGPVTVLDVTPTSISVPSAYVLELDTSGSMLDDAGSGQTYMERAKALARAFVAGLQPTDLVRVITFDVSASTKTGWLKKGDPAVSAAIASVGARRQPTYVSAALVAASSIADGRPKGIDRRAVVLITDADPADKDPNLAAPTMRNKLGPPTFIVGLRPSADVGTELGNLLSDVATYTGGGYVEAGKTPDPMTIFQPAWSSTRSGWAIHFRADAAPDTASHPVTLTITDASQRVGQLALTYQSGPLLAVSSLAFGGLASGDVIDTDRTVTVTTGGKTWPDARIDLFLDCRPSSCQPFLSADNAPLTWRLAAGPLAQGSHVVTARLTVRDAQGHQFVDAIELDFSRSGTTLNLQVVFLIGGIALIAMGGTYTAGRRRRAGANA